MPFFLCSAMASRTFNEAGAFAPEILYNWCALTRGRKKPSMRPGLLPRRYYVCKCCGQIVYPPSMRPGLLPRRYFALGWHQPMQPHAFNEAGAFAPEIFDRAGKSHRRHTTFNEAGAFAPEILACSASLACQGLAHFLASTRPMC